MVKNKNDKRYVRSKEGMEQHYFAEIRRQHGIVGVKAQTIYRGAHVHATTFFRHYRNLKGMVQAVRDDRVAEYNAAIRKVRRHGGKFHDVAYETFKFIERHADFFETAVAANNTEVLERIGEKLWKYARKTEYRYGMKRIEKVYVYEVIGVLTAWVEVEKCSAEKIDQYVAYVTKISSGGIKHLSLLADRE